MSRKSDYSFSQVPRADIPRSVFVRDHGYKTTLNENSLVPIYVDEALPGDTIKLNVSLFARLATPIVPIMDNLYADVFFFAVPNRLLWTHWVNMMGEQDNPADSISYTVPQIVGNNVVLGTLWDYFGLPTGIAQNISVSVLPFRAYNQIWNQWFRDENLQNSVPKNVGDGPDVYTDYVIKSRGKRHDYFTSCLPWPQKFTAPNLFLGGNATVKTSSSILVTGAQQPMLVYTSTGTVPPANAIIATGTTPDGKLWHSGSSASGQAAAIYPNNLYADLSTANAITINQLRQSFQIQKMLERDARGGTRYTEKIQAHFGVTSPDARLQRPEFLGGGTVNILVNPVAQTGPTVSGQTPQGNLAAFGVMHSNGNGFTKSFTEHCTLLGLLQIRADLNYQQGINRMWNRSTQYDFYWPALSHLGEQAVLNEEIYAQGTAADTQVFGYQERWAEYRYKPSVITGQFRSTAATPLDVWHLAQKFTALPTLGDTFIQDNPPISRVVAVPSQPRLLLDCYFSIRAARPMPVYSVPGLIDHF